MFCQLLSHVLPWGEMSPSRRTALEMTETNYLSYTGDICWEIEFPDCLFAVIAVYCEQRRSEELSRMHKM